MADTPPPPPLPSTTSTSAERTWSVLAHALALFGFFIPWAGHIIGPLIVYLAKRGESATIEAHAKESLNFQLSMLIYNALAALLCLVLIGLLLLPLLHIVNVILVIVASIRASEGKFYRYPFTIRLVD